MNKTQVKTALIPHNNDQMEIKFLQNSFSGIPFSPFYFFCQDSFDSDLTSVTLENNFVLIDGIWNLTAKAVFKDCEKKLFMKFIKTDKKLSEHSLRLSLKVFQLAKVQITQSGPLTEYTILESKWIKIPNPNSL